MSLAERLLALGYTDLFQRLDDDALRALLAEPGAEDALAALALDEDQDLRARFLAAEALPPARRAGAELARLYADALREQLTGAANEWSLPVRGLGRAGEHLLALGDAAIGPLAALLDDATPLLYEGSRDAMEAGLYGYRIKDLAAQFLARLTGLDFPASTDPAQRDAAIDDLRRRLR